MQFLEDEGEKVGVLITDIAKSEGGLCQVMGAEELVLTEGVSDVLHQLAHPPTLIELGDRIITLGPSLLASCARILSIRS